MVTQKTGKDTIEAGDPEILEDGEASEALTPGDLIELGGSNDYQKHATSGGNAYPLFNVELEEAGNSRSDDTKSGDTVKLAHCGGGERIIANVNKTDFSDGDFLESGSTAGHLDQHSAQSIDYSQTTGTTTIVDRKIVAVVPPDESISNSGGTDGADMVVLAV